MEYYAKINGVDYNFPKMVIDFNEKTFKENTTVLEEKNYLNLNKMFQEGKDKEISQITDQSVYTLMMLTNGLSQELTGKVEKFENLSKFFASKGNREKAFEQRIKELELVLSHYKQLTLEDESRVR